MSSYLQTLPILFFRFRPHKIFHWVTIWVKCSQCDYASSAPSILSRHIKKLTAGEMLNRCNWSSVSLSATSWVLGHHRVNHCCQERCIRTSPTTTENQLLSLVAQVEPEKCGTGVGWEKCG